MAEAAPRHGVELRFLSFPERPFPLAAIDARRLLADARGLSSDAVVLDSIAAAFAWPWFARGAPDLPVVAMLHQPPGGIDHGRLRTLLQARLDRLAYRHVERLLVASDSLADALRADGVPAERLRVVPPGRDVAEPEERGSLDLRRGRAIAVLCVGNWVPRKGIHKLLDAFARLPDHAAVLHLVGDDSADRSYAARIRGRLSEPDLSDRVVVHGPVSRVLVAALYRGADVFVLPSVREPYGTVWGEAMAAGLPVVGWRAGNLPYLADDGQEALLAEPGDVTGLAAALERLAGDEALRRRLGEAARLRASERPTWDESARLFFDAIREAAAKRTTDGKGH